MEYFSPIYGLITAADRGTENGGLFLAEYNTLILDDIGLAIYLEKMNRARTPEGLYKRSETHNARSVSHDEITGFMVSSYLFNTEHRFEVWKQLKSNFGAYPAIVMDFSDRLPFNPANFYNWGMYVGSFWAYLFLPFFIVNLMITANGEKGETSSKIMYWLKLETMPKTCINNRMKSYFERRMKAMYGENYLFGLYEIYFGAESRTEFPLWVEVQKHEG